jgi:hypothetical protein
VVLKRDNKKPEEEDHGASNLIESAHVIDLAIRPVKVVNFLPEVSASPSSRWTDHEESRSSLPAPLSGHSLC